jgi:hypothetical protein
VGEGCGVVSRSASDGEAPADTVVLVPSRQLQELGFDLREQAGGAKGGVWITTPLEEPVDNVQSRERRAERAIPYDPLVASAFLLKDGRSRHPNIHPVSRLA